MPDLPSNVRRTSSGSDAPPETATRSADTSRPEMSGCARACSMVGTPPTTVHRSRSIASSATEGWNRGRIDRQLPYRTLTLMIDESPNARLVDRFITEVIGAPVILVGNSMGGQISIMATAANKDAIKGLVLIDPALPPPRKPDWRVTGQFLLYAPPRPGEPAVARMPAS